MKKVIISCLAVLCVVVGASAQTVKVSGGADLVSAYIWRGSYNAGASIQPSIDMTVKGFSLGAWGSTDFGGNGKKEIDLAAKYSFKGLTIGVTDYWWDGEQAFNYFHYASDDTGHRFEGSISYALPFEKFPLVVSWSTFFAGADVDQHGKRNYSTYIELYYPFAAGPVDMKVIVGVAPWYSPAFLPSEKHGFSVCNVSVAAQKAIKCTPKFSIPLFSQLTFNPETEDIHLVFGLSLKF